MQRIQTAQGRFYKSERTGELLPSVTTVLSTVYPFHGEAQWVQKQIAEGKDPQSYARRGTLLHEIAQKALEGELAYPEQFLSDPQAGPFIQNLIKGLELTIAQYGAAIATEQHVEGLWYAGTYDVLFKDCLLDIKTSDKPWKPMSDRPWFDSSNQERKAWLQLIGYMATIEQPPQKAAILIVTPDIFEVREARIYEEDLNLWSKVQCLDNDGDPDDEDYIYCKYLAKVAQREAEGREAKKRSDVIKGFHF